MGIAIVLQDCGTKPERGTARDRSRGLVHFLLFLHINMVMETDLERGR